MFLHVFTCFYMSWEKKTSPDFWGICQTCSRNAQSRKNGTCNVSTGHGPSASCPRILKIKRPAGRNWRFISLRGRLLAGWTEGNPCWPLCANRQVGLEGGASEAEALVVPKLRVAAESFVDMTARVEALDIALSKSPAIHEVHTAKVKRGSKQLPRCSFLFLLLPRLSTHEPRACPFLWRLAGPWSRGLGGARRRVRWAPERRVPRGDRHGGGLRKLRRRKQLNLETQFQRRKPETAKTQ